MTLCLSFTYMCVTIMFCLAVGYSWQIYHLWVSRFQTPFLFVSQFPITWKDMNQTVVSCLFSYSLTRVLNCVFYKQYTILLSITRQPHNQSIFETAHNECFTNSSHMTIWYTRKRYSTHLLFIVVCINSSKLNSLL